MENIKFGALLYDIDSLADALGGDGDLLRVNSLTRDEADELFAILSKHDIRVCLFPFCE